MVDERNDMSPGLISGRLEGMSFPDLMWALSRRKAGGVLRLTRGNVRKSVYFEAGKAVFASSSDPDDRLGELLLREGLVRLRDLDAALQHIGHGKRIGTLLVEAGHLSPQDLVQGVLLQVRSIVLDLFTWDDGEYDFETGSLPTEEVITLDMPVGEIMFQGIRQVRSFSRIRRSVGVARTRYRAVPDAADRVTDAEMTAGEEQLLARVRRDGATVEDLCREVFMSNFEVYQALWAFKVLGMVEETESAGTTVTDATLAGTFGAEGIAPLLVRLCRAGETGVLYLSRGPRERTIHLKDGRCSFATSNNIDDGLVLYLLRRGVISLRDREETAKRLLSNKRVGTILREMGVLDDLDLRNMVREHLGEIIHDTIAWSEGEYAFVAGELPTVEEITLDVPIEELVSTALHRVTSWSRVRDGIGGLDAPLALTPDFLAVLDRMNIGPAEWDVVTALKHPRTAAETAAKSDLGDYRVCRILWSLHILGAVAAAPEQADTADPVHADDVAVSDVEVAPVTTPVLAWVDEALVGPETEVEVEEVVAVEEDPVDEVETIEPTAPVEVVPVADPIAKFEVVDATSEDARPAFVEEVAYVDEAASEDEPELAAAPDASMFEVAVSPPDDPVAAWQDAPDAGAPPAPDSEFEIDDRAERGDAPVGSGTGLLEDRGGLDDGDEFQAATPGVRPFEIDVDNPVADDSLEHDGLDDDLPAWAGDAVVPPVDTGAFDVPVVETLDRPEVDAFDVEAVDEPEEEVRDDLDSTRAFTREEIVAALRAGELAAGKVPEVEPEVGVVDLEDEGEDDRDEDEVADRIAVPIVSASDEDDDAEDRTEEIPRVEIEAAIEGSGGHGGNGDSTVEEPEPAIVSFEPSEDLEGQIERFNARQRVLYRTIRAEVGAGAFNFVRSCCGRVTGDSQDPFIGADMRPDGTWDVDGLRQAAIEQRIEAPGRGYEQLIETEIEMLRIHIGEARTRALKAQIDRLESAHPA